MKICTKKICTQVEAAMSSTCTAPKIITRGTTIQFKAAFTVDGEPVTPASATVRVLYPLGESMIDSGPITMGENGGRGVWEALWQSAVSSAGVASWSIEATNDDGLISRRDGEIRLTAGGANPEP